MWKNEQPTANVKNEQVYIADNRWCFMNNLTGILAGVRPCGVIVLLAELFRAESKSQVYANLHEFMRRHPRVLENMGMSTYIATYLVCSLIVKKPTITTWLNCHALHIVEKAKFLTLYGLSLEFICYDDGCHLRKFAQQSTRKNVTPTAQKLSKVEIVVDKLHMEGHTDAWCKANCDPYLFKALDKVSICQIRKITKVHTPEF